MMANACASTEASVGAVISTLYSHGLDTAAVGPGLYDELAMYTPQPKHVTQSEHLAKALDEFRVFRACARRPQSLDPESLNELMMDIHTRCGVGSTRIRKTTVQIATDPRNTVTVFPRASEIEFVLSDLFGFIARNIVTRNALCAAVGYVGIVHAHPFSDGNGRTARVFYNVLRSYSGSSHFLPIRFLGAMTKGALTVKQRRAYLTGEWSSIFEFFRDATVLSDNRQRVESAP